MERYTVTESFEGRYRLHLNQGGAPMWCMFDFAVYPAPPCDGFVIELVSSADPVSSEWFPHLRLGMQRAVEAARARGREWVGVRVEIRKIHAHPVDTTARACERYGTRFVEGLSDRGVLLPGQPTA